MWRFLLAAIILFVIGGIFFMVPEEGGPTPEDPFLTLQHIMNLAEASIAEGEIHYWALLGSSPGNLSPQDLESRADEFLQRLAKQDQKCACAAENTPGEPAGGIKNTAAAAPAGTGVPDMFGGQTSGYGLSLSGAGGSSGSGAANVLDRAVEREQELYSGGHARLSLQQMDQDNQKVTHLQLTITRKGDAARLGDLASRLPAAFGSEAESSNLSFCLTGHIDGRLDPARMEQLARDITREIGGEEVRSIQDGGMISVTGYLPELGDYLQAENLRINLNLALRYDDYLGKTAIWAGTPLIARQY